MKTSERVLACVRDNPGASNRDIRNILDIPRRTTYAALRRLKAQGLVRETPDLRDTRMSHFWPLEPIRMNEPPVATQG